jgi:beta-galactosidase
MATAAPTSTPAAPVFTHQAGNRTVVEESTARFISKASGTKPLHYQWMKNGTNIPGATSAWYTTPATTMADSGSRCAATVTNSLGSVTSNNATLTVTP